MDFTSTFHPTASHRDLEVVKSGDALVINGVTYDFSGGVPDLSSEDMVIGTPTMSGDQVAISIMGPYPWGSAPGPIRRVTTTGDGTIAQTVDGETVIYGSVSNVGHDLSLNTDPWRPVPVEVWHPYDKVLVGDGNVGKVFDFAEDGAITELVLPDFDDGFDYRLNFFDMSVGSFTFEVYAEPAGAWRTVDTGRALDNAENVIDINQPLTDRRVKAGEMLFVDRGSISTEIWEHRESGDPLFHITRCRCLFTGVTAGIIQYVRKQNMSAL